jgi:hypothetical protein
MRHFAPAIIASTLALQVCACLPGTDLLRRSDAPLATLQTVGYNLLWVSIQDVKREALKVISHFTFHVLSYRNRLKIGSQFRKNF